MDFRLIATAFITVFLAELGDKTSLSTLALASKGRVEVFIGASVALVLNVAMAVLLAEWIERWVSPMRLQQVAGVLFLLLGGYFLWGARAIGSS